MDRRLGYVGNEEAVRCELYFLIAKYLSDGPCRRSAEELKRELEEHELLPKRLDWRGGEHPRTFDDLVNSNSHISSGHLLKICQQIGPLLDRDLKPGASKVNSLLGSGRQSLLRTKDDFLKSCLSLARLSARQHGCPMLLPPNLVRQPTTVQILISKEISGPLTCQQLMPSKFYKNVQQFCRRLGHLSSVYCILFDRTGRYIFTGADDLLVKIWSVQDGRLLETLRGHSAEITDMAVNYENTLLAAGSCDKIIRVWCLKTVSPVAVLVGHTGMITSLQFCPSPRGENRYLVSTGTDGCIYFWMWNVATSQFNPQPRKFTDRNRPGAQLICASFSPGGNFVVTGSTDHHVRVYNVFGQGGPEKIHEVEAHSDRVDSIQFANGSERFVSGSRDGTANIWRLERQKWRTILLRMSTRLPGDPPQDLDDTKVPKFKVTMVGWDLEDRHVITAVNDFSIKVWDSYSGKLIYRLEGHDDEAFVLECHPTDPRIVLSAGHDGRIILWDLTVGVPVKKFFNVIEGQGHGAVFDCKFSPDGNLFASTDSHGHLCVFGYGSSDKYKKLPDELFFHTDYRPLLRDSNHHVLDEQTQQAPHLMPPPFLVNIDGNPYPPELQRFVPGRENCNDSQLVPYVVVNAGGDADVFDVNDTDNQRPSIDVMIQRLQHEQAVRRGPQAALGPGPMSPRAVARPPNSMPSPAHSLIGMRRSGDVEGVRQSQGDWQGSAAPTQGELLAWSRRVSIPSLLPTQLYQSESLRLAFGDREVQRYKRVDRRRRSEASEGDHSYHHRRPKPKLKRVIRIPIRPLKLSRQREATERSSPSSSSDGGRAWDSSSDSDTESSEYSDWTQDAGINLKPPKRNRQALARNRRKPMRIVDDDEDLRQRQLPTTLTSKRKRPDANRAVPDEAASSVPLPVVAEGDAEVPLPRPVEVPLAYRPPEWLTGTVPHKAPYYPQMGDEIIYFQQGHRCYVDAVKRARVYTIADKNQPWRTMTVREQELVKVVGIKYEIRPPRLCCLKLAMIDPETSKMNGQSFTIKYHDMPDVIDFLVLRQTYDTAMSRNWKQGDRFRSMIDNAWWVGTIESHEPFQTDYSDSMFQCFNVAWDNGEREKMSPWDLEPLDEERMPSNVGGSIEVLPHELKALLYKPRRGEWPEHEMDEECDRIIRGLEQVMELSIAEPFTAPVDLNRYPTYARIVEYPVDLGIVKARLENRFYRRVTSIQFDVRYVECNARKFNEAGSVIVKQARIVTDLCLKLIEDSTCTEIKPLYQELTENADSDENTEVNVDTDTGSHHEGSSEDDVAISMRKLRMKKNASNASDDADLTNAWKDQCKELIAIIYGCEDSEAFRRPVDPVEYPHYREIIDIPMDFGTVRSQMMEDHYPSPIEFCKDVRLIFQNSRNYNTNKKSRIYSMTIRLSAMFEDQIRSIISDWRSVVTYEQRLRNNQYVSNRRKPLPQLRPEVAPSSQPSTSSYSSRSRNKKARNSSRRVLKSSKSRNKKRKGESARRRHPVNNRQSARTVGRKKKVAASEEEEDEEENEESDHEPRRDNRGRKSVPTRRQTRSQQTSDQPKRPRSLRLANGHSTKPVSARPSRGCSRVIDDSDGNATDTDTDTDNRSRSEDEEPVEEPRSKPESTVKRKVGRPRKYAKSRESSEETVTRPGSSSSGATISQCSAGTRVRASGSSKSNSGSSSSSSSSSSPSSSDGAGNNKEEGAASSGGDGSATEGDCDDYAVRRSKRTYTRCSTMATRNVTSTRRSRAEAAQVERICSSGRGSKRRRSETEVEEEDDDDDDDDEGEPSASRRSKRIATRNLGKRTVRYREDSDFEYDFDTEQNDSADLEDDGRRHRVRTSISSRGRIRKLTPLARSLIRR